MRRPTPRAREDQLFADFRRTQDPESLGLVYRLTVESLRRSARRIVEDAALAEDAVQQTFLRAIERAELYDTERPLMPWLHGILVNEIRVLRRRRRPRCGAGDHVECPTMDFDPQALAAQSELRVRVEAMIGSLPVRYRAVLRMRLLQGLSNTDIATVLRRPPATVRIQVMRGLELLRRALPGSFATLMLLAGLPASRREPGPSEAVEATSGFRTWGLVAAGILGVAMVVMAWQPGVNGAAGLVAARILSATPDAPRPDVSTRRESLPGAGSTPAATSVEPGLSVQVRWHDGRPAPGLWVRARPQSVSNPYLHDRWVQVDDAGRARIQGLPAGLVELVGDRGGKVLATVGDGATRATLTLAAGYSVAGAVLDEAGQPVAGAAIWLSTSDNAEFGHVVTLADGFGRFRIRGVVGEHYVGARTGSGTHGASWLARTSGRAGQEVSVRLTMNRACGRVMGIVWDGCGHPVARARVFVGSRARQSKIVDDCGRERTRWPNFEVWTDDRGFFRVAGVPRGKVAVTAMAPGYFGVMRMVQVGENTDHDLSLDLVKGGCVEGRVTDDRGHAVAAARVSCNGISDHWRSTGALTDRDGRFRILDGFLGHVTLWIDGGRAGAASKRLRLRAPVAVECNIVLARPRLPIRGVLRDAAGEPLAGWTIDARAHRSWKGPWRQRRVATDQDGRFLFVSAPAEQHTLFALPPGCICPCGPGLVVEPKDADWEFALTSKQMPEAGIRGRLAEAGCDRLAGVEVTLTREGWVARSGCYWDHLRVPLAEDGSFELGEIPPGEYRATVYAQGHPPRSVQGLLLIAGRTLDLGTLGVGRCTSR